MAQTVAECLTAGMDSVTLINSINTDASAESKVEGMTQAEINVMVQKNVDHLEIILAYDGTDDLPNITGSSSSKKTDCTNAITTGKAYISANS
jgi:hypothetical protein|tara:strand:+ start:386 stop:664 length:279 start_codon:yes stop_codon:yes gene_type:complete